MEYGVRDGCVVGLERLKDEHSSAMRMADIAREGSLTESNSLYMGALSNLQDEHAQAVAKKEEQFKADIGKAQSEHAALLLAKDEDHRAKREVLKKEQSAALENLRDEHEEV